MGKNIVEKILATHLTDGMPVVGQEIGIAIDQTLTQDSAGTMAYLQFASMGIPKIQSKLSVAYIDHQTLQDGFENADDHCFLQSAGNRFGAFFSKAGNGICHQVNLERFSRPGWTMIGTDSHTPTAGSVGMLAVGAGGLDVASAMGGGSFYLPYPNVILIRLHGQLQPWCTAKDVALEILKIMTVKGNVGKILEYGGEGAATLSITERATIANMGTETGVSTSIFPSDEITQIFFRQQRRESDWQPLAADPDASYDQIIDLDLCAIEPNVAQPHSPGNIAKIRDISGLKVDQVLIGSCTNASYQDLMMVSSLVKGKVANKNVSFAVAPGSRQVYRMMAQNDALDDLSAAGARILEPTCGFCVGCGQAPRSGAVSIRTNNRNFLGRSGTLDAKVYLVSPLSAAVAALTGHLLDPRDAGLEAPKWTPPPQFLIDDSLILKPNFQGELQCGPNIGAPPVSTPFPSAIKGRVALKVGDHITTDHILPAGPLLKYRSNIVRYSEYVFCDVDAHFVSRCKENQSQQRPSIIVGGISYGQGSSREHAAICPMHLGVRVVLAKSIERIHWNNLINFGILPLFFQDEADYEKIDLSDTLQIDHLADGLKTNRLLVQNTAKRQTYPVECKLSDRQIEILLAGGLLNYTKTKR